MSDLLDHAVNLAVIAGVLFGAWQISKLRESNSLQEAAIKADHERQKKQSTIEFYHEINEEVAALTLAIEEAGVGDSLTVETIESDENLTRSARRYLQLMERFAVGVNTGVYDIHVFDRIAGRSTIRRFKKLEPYVNARREELSLFTLYRDLEDLIAKLEEVRRERFPSGESAIGLPGRAAIENDPLVGRPQVRRIRR